MGGVVAALAEKAPGNAPHSSLLIAAGYVLYEDLELWLHPGLDRALDANVAAILTPDQLQRWVADGR